jgi:hypothetical protein
MGEWTLHEGEYTASRPDRFIPKESAPATHSAGGGAVYQSWPSRCKEKLLILSGIEL